MIVNLPLAVFAAASIATLAVGDMPPPAGPGFASPDVQRDDSPVDFDTVLAGQANLSTYRNLFQTYPSVLTQIVNKMPTVGGFTLIAPTDEAFKKAGDTFNPKNASQATALLSYHVWLSKISMAATVPGPYTFAQTLLSTSDWTNVTGGQYALIARQPDVIIITSGTGSRSTVVQQDIPFSGGLIQVVDTLLVPPPRLEPIARVYYTDMTAFLAALYATDLIRTFADQANVTIFAPSNSAFQRVAGTLEGLSKDQLAEIMRYHIVPGAVIPDAALTNASTLSSGDFAAVSSVTLPAASASASGNSSSTTSNATSTTAANATTTSTAVGMRITRAGNNLYINNAQVIQPDILVANGVVHLIDNVLNPAGSATADPNLGTQAPAFSQAGATETGTGVPTPFTTWLPCTTGCPVSSSSVAPSVGGGYTASSSSRTRTSTGGAAAARCTGLVAGMGAGLLGMGLIGVV